MRLRRRHVAALACIAAGLLGALPAFGWGAEGHRLVGDVAEDLLDARTRAALRDLTGGERLADIGLWLDRERDALKDTHPGSERWHYDNRPDCNERATEQSYCADGNCASAAYARYRAVLANHRVAPAQRLFALRVVVHVLGDIHQPLHSADNDDRGGNGIEVGVGRRHRAKSLHAAWDVDFVRRAMQGESEHAFADRLVAEHADTRALIAQGDFGDWARESWQLAHAYAYGQLPGFACGIAEPSRELLPAAYSDGAARIVREQLARAGIRLARELEATL